MTEQQITKLKTKTNERIDEIIDVAYSIGFDEGIVSQQAVINDLIKENEKLKRKVGKVKELIAQMGE